MKNLGEFVEIENNNFQVWRSVEINPEGFGKVVENCSTEANFIWEQLIINLDLLTFCYMSHSH